jgi:hypothetical protein
MWIASLPSRLEFSEALLGIHTTFSRSSTSRSERYWRRYHPNRTKDDAGFSVPPLYDRGSRYHFAILSGCKTTSIFPRYNVAPED